MIYNRIATPKFPIESVRYVVKFAYLPTELSDGCMVWLENYHVIQAYRRASRTKFEWVTTAKCAIPKIKSDLVEGMVEVKDDV